jgi:multidrug efflux pump subunit AcrA (membrane-fusion protein)
VPALRKELSQEWDKKHEAEVKLKIYQESAAVAPLLKAESKAHADYESAKKSVSSLKSQVAEAEETASSLKDASKKAREAQEDASHSTSNAVKEQKNALKNAYGNAKGNLDTPSAEVRKAQRELDSSIVVAKTDGIVTSVNVRPGDIYQGDAIAVIQDDSSYRVSATADQYDISSLAVDQDVKISVNAAGMSNTAGTLIYVGRAPMVSENGSVGVSGGSEASGGTGGSDAVYRVEALIDEPGEKMRIGMTAKVLVTVWKKDNCLAVPDEAIQTDENGNNYITVQDDDGETRDIHVKYGMKTDYYSEIIGKGLKKGLKVVVPSFDEEEGTETEE